MTSTRSLSRSTSDPFLFSATSSKTRIPASNRSTCSGSKSSTKSVYWLAWSNVSKLNSVISIGRQGRDSSSSRHSDLTEESLEAHNRRQQQEAFIFQSDNDVDGKNAKCSPYYKGLTDYSLIINREKLQYLPHQPSSPGRESHATTSSSISSFMLIKIQEWSSCFSSFKSSNKEKQNNAPAPVSAPPPPPTNPPVPAPPYFAPPPLPVVANTITIEQDPCCSSNSTTAKMPLKRKETDTDDLSVIKEEKPLRERVSISESESPSQQPLQHARGEANSTSNVDEKDGTDMDVFDGEKKFTWADKYRPKTLKEFICNRTTAAQVQGLVRYCVHIWCADLLEKLSLNH